MFGPKNFPAFLAATVTSIALTGAHAQENDFSEPDWSAEASILVDRANPYSLDDAAWAETVRAGRVHALAYPIHFSGTIVPWRPLKRFLDERSSNPIRAIFHQLFATFYKVGSSDDLFAHIGLHPYPRNDAEGAKEIPNVGGGARTGATVFRRDSVEALTVSCAACHSANLFGKKILGMTNRFPRGNEIFVQGKKAATYVNESLFHASLPTSEGEDALYARFRQRVRAVGAKLPATLGLDTSLAQVALSLAHRQPDPYATFSTRYEDFPRHEPLATFVADSKPAVWWNLKYKNRWLSDGSVVSGNPIYTNLLWNEIGRGTDLRELEAWLAENPATIRELTTAAFAAEAPRFTDFFPAERISLARARNGERIFNTACAKCHGVYEKTWNLPDTETLPLVERLRTSRVRYHAKTPVIDVGTDPNRYKGMESLARGLNPLAISQANGVRIETQTGYVPPPLVGIWARYPYFHNNSAPTLCAVLTPAEKRPVRYWAGEALDPARDFDAECVGYPLGDKTPREWTRDPTYLYDTTRAGMSNRGHDVGIFVKEGVEIFTREEKLDLIEFMKTL